MNYKKEMILRIEKVISEEMDKLDEIVDPHDRFIALDTLFKVHKYLINFDDLEPVLDEYFKEKHKKDKWEER